MQFLNPSFKIFVNRLFALCLLFFLFISSTTFAGTVFSVQSGGYRFYWDLSKDADNQKAMKAESGRIIQKMIEAKNAGASTQRPAFTRRRAYECETLEEDQFVVADDYIQDVKERAAQHAAQKNQ